MMNILGKSSYHLMTDSWWPFTDDDGPEIIELDPGEELVGEFKELRKNAETHHSKQYSDDELFARLLIAATYERLNRELQEKLDETDENETDLRYHH